jgi:hypothetical protein
MITIDRIVLQKLGRKLGWIVAAAIGVGAVSGCAESNATRRARITRQEAFNRDIGMVKSLEDHRSENLAATADVIEKRAQRDQEATRRDLKALADWLPNEAKEWKQKQPDYEKAIKHHLEGNPASIEQTAPYFVY